MNTRFFLNFLTAAKRNTGFAMPMVIMGGLVITVAAAAIAMKGMNDQNQVTSKAMKQQSEAVAEAGVTQIQNFLLGSKFMALYPKDKWETAITVNGDGTVVINDTDLQKYVTKIATNLASGGGASGNSACSSGTPPTSAEITTKETQIKSALKDLRTAAVTGKDLVTGDSSKGKFRLTSFSYQGYDSATGQSYYPPAGKSWLAQMTVEGEVPGKETKTTITTTFPISVTPESSDTPFDVSTISPGLWVKEGGVNDLSKSETSYNDSAGTIDGDIAISDCGGNISNTYMGQLNAAQKSRGYEAYRTDAPMPSIPSVPTGVTPYTLSGSASLPRVGEVPAADGYFYYSSPSNLGDITLDHSGGKKYRIYLYGDIPKTTSVNSNCKTTAGCVPTNLQIFGMKSSGGEICMNGNSDRAVDAFVLAPNYALGKTGNGNFYGTFIVKSFGKIGSCGSNNGKLAIVSSQPSNTVPNEFTNTTSSAYPIPAIGASSTWQSLETSTTGTVPSLSPLAQGGRLVSQPPLVSGVSSSSSIASGAASSISSQVSSTASSATSSTSSMASSAQSSVSSTLPLSSITDRVTCIAAGGKWNNGQKSCR
ncbi:hypothetical protein [Synechocystis salina]|uniref:Uncharacterized protein n=1 Tax=Synechocystis salina LEGE 00031 TaxID=1828736 RepID=A0ABR9VM97_9SYNC|nr:hypothetical protein [Synechocystis salina]MBE9239704.1 hypothetical protein [Synechocystis salina LEGE 00041]MBE9252439.1 hypothetical protein [Synechocystis salina LEGE 00031]